MTIGQVKRHQKRGTFGDVIIRSPFLDPSVPPRFCQECMRISYDLLLASQCACHSGGQLGLYGGGGRGWDVKWVGGKAGSLGHHL